MSEIRFIKRKSTKCFQINDSLRKLVYHTLNIDFNFFLDDILAALTFSSNEKEDLLEMLRCAEMKYSHPQYNNHINDFYKIKGLILDLYKSGDQTDNLRGVFLESLVNTHCNSKYTPSLNSLDCLVKIDDWTSKYTVDVAILCHDKGKIYSCKTSVKELTHNIINDLKDIKINSKHKLKPFFITLQDENRLKLKLDQLNKEVPLSNHVVFICREDLSSFLS